jgi:pre-rRNA-processing protein TSR4
MAAEHDGGSDAESEEERCEWLLGFVQPPRKRTDLLRHRFPSKVGGRPAWLDPLHLPTEEQLTCRVTGKPLNYLLQVLPPAAARAATRSRCRLRAVAGRASSQLFSFSPCHT